MEKLKGEYWMVLIGMMSIMTFFVGGSTSVANEDYIAVALDYAPVKMATYSPNPISQDQARNIMWQNIQQLSLLTQEIVGKYQAQIIVYPEDSLYGPMFFNRDQVLPYLEEIPNMQAGKRYCPCGNVTYDHLPVQQNLSCIAKSNRIVVVANMGEVVWCKNSTQLKVVSKDESASCPPDHRFQYNTQVVFDEDGCLLAKYHKSHLYYEPQWNVGDALPVYFDTSFGVRFGLLICYDIMWPEPQQSLHRMGIKNFAFSAWWVNNSPIITGTMSQLAWSRLYHANLIASSVGQSWYNSGSGVYASGVAIHDCYNPSINPTLCLAVGSLPFKPVDYQNPFPFQERLFQDSLSFDQNPSKVPSFLPYQEINSLSNFTFTMMETQAGLKTELTASSGRITCHVDVLIHQDSDANEIYVLAALDGLYRGLFDAQICAFTRCVTKSDCLAWNLHSETLFDRVAISMEREKGDEPRLQMLAMADRKGAELFDSHQVAYTDSRIQIGQSHKSLNTTILNASLFGIVWD